MPESSQGNTYIFASTHRTSVVRTLDAHLPGTGEVAPRLQDTRHVLPARSGVVGGADFHPAKLPVVPEHKGLRKHVRSLVEPAGREERLAKVVEGDRGWDRQLTVEPDPCLKYLGVQANRRVVPARALRDVGGDGLIDGLSAAFRVSYCSTDE